MPEWWKDAAGARVEVVDRNGSNGAEMMAQMEVEGDVVGTVGHRGKLTTMTPATMRANKSEEGWLGCGVGADGYCAH